MPADAWLNESGAPTLNGVRVGRTDAKGLNLDPDLSGSWLNRRTLDELKVSVGFVAWTAHYAFVVISSGRHRERSRW